jgi:hypothetical protein
MMPSSVYLPPADGEKIIDLLGQFLPYEHRDQDFLDKITHKLHF